MIFAALAIAGSYQIDIEPRADERGMFARSYCAAEFAAHQLPSGFVQCNVSFNPQRGTLRGLHYQDAPKPEAKLVRCTRGAAFDVIVDLRRDSPSFRRWVGIELTADNRRAVFVPEGCAHGFQTIAADTELFYQMSEFYEPELARGVRWNDPAFGVAWPLSSPILSDRDARFADFT
jgi:dTDP-4-dehydrorhamnose 3,5-epimerase